VSSCREGDPKRAGSPSPQPGRRRASRGPVDSPKKVVIREGRAGGCGCGSTPVRLSGVNGLRRTVLPPLPSLGWQSERASLLRGMKGLRPELAEVPNHRRAHATQHDGGATWGSDADVRGGLVRCGGFAFRTF
jgi:hypothetical protein